MSPPMRTGIATCRAFLACIRTGVLKTRHWPSSHHATPLYCAADKHGSGVRLAQNKKTGWAD